MFRWIQYRKAFMMMSKNIFAESFALRTLGYGVFSCDGSFRSLGKSFPFLIHDFKRAFAGAYL